jgi:hypothetical protein
LANLHAGRGVPDFEHAFLVGRDDGFPVRAESDDTRTNAPSLRSGINTRIPSVLNRAGTNDHCPGQVLTISN